MVKGRRGSVIKVKWLKPVPDPISKQLESTSFPITIVIVQNFNVETSDLFG